MAHRCYLFVIVMLPPSASMLSKFDNVRLDGVIVNVILPMVGEKDGTVISGKLIFLTNVVRIVLNEVLMELTIPANIQPAIC